MDNQTINTNTKFVEVAPDAYAALPKPYRENNVLEFWWHSNDYFGNSGNWQCRPKLAEIPRLGSWQCWFDSGCGRWYDNYGNPIR